MLNMFFLLLKYCVTRSTHFSTFNFILDGKHDGFIHGRRYFQCKAFHGVFVRPSQVRFSQNKTRLVPLYMVLRQNSKMFKINLLQ